MSGPLLRLFLRSNIEDKNKLNAFSSEQTPTFNFQLYTGRRFGFHSQKATFAPSSPNLQPMNALVHAHSGLRYVVLALLIAAVGIAYSKWQLNDPNDSKIYTYALISVHIQLLLGIVLYVMSPKVDFGMMSDKLYRFFTVEHSLMMLIAIILITVGRVRSRKVPVDSRHRTILFYYAMGLILILVSIPWPFRGLGAGWF